MKTIWSNLFYDLENCGDTKEDFAKKAGDDIRSSLSDIERKLKSFETKEALELIKNLKSEL
jgi:hypothetical protein